MESDELMSWVMVVCFLPSWLWYGMWYGMNGLLLVRVASATTSSRCGVVLPNRKKLVRRRHTIRRRRAVAFFPTFIRFSQKHRFRVLSDPRDSNLCICETSVRQKRPFAYVSYTNHSSHSGRPIFLFFQVDGEEKNRKVTFYSSMSSRGKYHAHKLMNHNTLTDGNFNLDF